jgi:geranylgeranylglycerol-phosphate geranylgeranyltransferase
MQSQLTKTKAIFLLTRPVNVLIAILSVFVAAFITGTIQPIENVIIACISCGLIFAAANTINDYYDFQIDKINKPNRPLPSGLINPGTAFVVSIIEYTIGIILGGIISLNMFFMAAFFSALSFFYSAHLKRTVLWGNLAVSLSTAAVFIYGGMAVRRPIHTIIPAVFAFFYHFGREIIKDIQDMKGDSENAAKTFPLKFGITPALRLTWINFLLLIFLTILPYWKNWYSLNYFLIVVLGMYPVIFYVLISIMKNTEPKHLGFLCNLLKANMFMGLLAIYFR